MSTRSITTTAGKLATIADLETVIATCAMLVAGLEERIVALEGDITATAIDSEVPENAVLYSDESATSRHLHVIRGAEMGEA